MAKLIITGTAASLKSGLKMAEIKRVQKLAEKDLVMWDDDKKPIFTIEIDTKHAGTISKHGVTFDKRDKSGFAMVTIAGDTNYEEMEKKDVAEMFMDCLVKLNQLEAHVKEVVLPDLNRRADEATAMITFADAEITAEPEAITEA